MKFKILSISNISAAAVRLLQLFVLSVLLLCASSPVLADVPDVTPVPDEVLTPAMPSPTPAPTPSPSPSPAPAPTPEPPTPEPEPEPVTIKLQFAGDIMIHAHPITHGNIGGNEYDFKPFFQVIKPYIDGDLAICNMEAPIDAHGNNEKISTFPTFNAPFEILEALKDTGFNHIITANNHAFDQRLAGVESTLANLEKAGLASTGTYLTQEAFDTPTILDINGILVGIIAYTDSYNGIEAWVPADMLPFLMRKFNSNNLSSLPQMQEDINAIREAGAELVILSLHWGAEYVDKPSSNQRKLAEALCDAGADIIMGHHSHCVQPVEWYTASRGGSGDEETGTQEEGAETAECLIMYSLGNFFADQMTELDKLKYGMLVDAAATKSPDGEISIELLRIVPTLGYEAYSVNGLDRFRLMPLDNIHGEQRPDFIPDNSAWAWAKRAYEHVAGIVTLVDGQ